MLTVVLALLGAACRAPGDGGYEVTASFPRATALFEQSRVQVMGIDVGRVDTIRIDGDRIVVTMLIDPEVPLPADVNAAIVPLTLIGERNVVLHPPFRPGDERVADGHEIPVARTQVAVEPDDVLQTVTDLVQAIDPDRLSSVLTDAAGALDGQGEVVNDAVAQGARLTEVLRAQDDRLVAAAEGLDGLATSLNRREEQLADLLDVFAEATSMLADERDRIRAMLGALADLNDEANAVVSVVEETLAEDVAALATLAMTLEANSVSVVQAVAVLPRVSAMLIRAYLDDIGGLRLRFTGNETFFVAVNQVLGALGLALIEECVPMPNVDCGGGG